MPRGRNLSKKNKRKRQNSNSNSQNTSPHNIPDSPSSTISSNAFSQPLLRLNSTSSIDSIQTPTTSPVPSTSITSTPTRRSVRLQSITTNNSQNFIAPVPSTSKIYPTPTRRSLRSQSSQKSTHENLQIPALNTTIQNSQTRSSVTRLTPRQPFPQVILTNSPQNLITPTQQASPDITLYREISSQPQPVQIQENIPSPIYETVFPQILIINNPSPPSPNSPRFPMRRHFDVPVAEMLQPIVQHNEHEFFPALNGREPVLAEINLHTVEAHNLGDFNKICPNCSALSFMQETLNCCRSGIVTLPPLPPYPRLLYNLFLRNRRFQGHFIRYIMRYNNQLSFAAVHAKLRQDMGRGAPVYVISGMIRHAVGDVGFPAARFFGSIYFLDAAEASGIRENDSRNCRIEILNIIHNFLRENNPFARLYRSLREVVDEARHIATLAGEQIPNIGIRFLTEIETDRRQYSAPTNPDEVGVVFQSRDGDVPPSTELEVYYRDEGPDLPLRYISNKSELADPLCYPILFPFGSLGWKRNLKSNAVPQEGRRVRQKISIREFYMYRLQHRTGESYNILLNAGKLSQQFFVDAYVKIESERLEFLRTHQDDLRVDTYAGLADHVHRLNNLRDEQGQNKRIGRIIVLPSTFGNGPRFLMQQYQDCMSVVAKFGKPTLFITVTCNPNWPEIVERLAFPGQTPQDRPDILARVFYQKFTDLLTEVKNGLFGTVTAYVYTIEFQKIGLPHAHLLITLDDDYKLREPTDIDRLISAELPDPVANPELFDIVLKTMIHGPCDDRFPNAPCRDPESGICVKGYPKSYTRKTTLQAGSYPVYRRRNDGNTGVVVRNRKHLDVNNRDVVPYSPYLTKKYRSHINTEMCFTVDCCKYLFKYINKGADSAVVQLRHEDEWNEIIDYVESRYVSACEAAWRIFALPMHGKSHQVVRLAIHVQGEKEVRFVEGQENAALLRAQRKPSSLEAYFLLNRTCAEARQYFYLEIPVHFVIRDGIWVKRRRRRNNIIVRMYTVSPRYVEKFHLRLLLLHVKGAVSFTDLRTVDGEVCATFKEAADRLQLTATDAEWEVCLQHAAEVDMPRQMRKLFCYLVAYCNVNDPPHLWDLFKGPMSHDYLRRGGVTIDQAANRALRNVLRFLRILSINPHDIGFPAIDPFVQIDVDIDDNDEEDDEQRPNIDQVEDNIHRLNDHQRQLFDNIIKAVRDPSNERRYFYLQGSGGTGKTFLYNTILESLAIAGVKTTAVALTGIAALLLHGGQTCHSKFKLPLDLHAESRSSLTLQSTEARELAETQLIIWDEVTMASCFMLDLVDELMRDLKNIQRPFGGVCVLLGGDVKQLLPVAESRTRSVELFFPRARCWGNFETVHLLRNMRTEPGEEEFADWLVRLGTGRLPSPTAGFVDIPPRCIVDNVVEATYGDVTLLSPTELAERTILCPKNDACNTINDKVLAALHGQETITLSVDSVVTDDDDERQQYPVEYLNSLNISGMPVHKLVLKTGAPIMLLRNLCLREGLTNGTRLTVVSVRQSLLEAKIAIGRFKGKTVFLPRMDLTSKDSLFPFTLQRRQFPVKVCFAMTMNKAQGQTFDRVGIYLPSHVFAHGQLYVAFSRVRNWNSVKVQLAHQKRKNAGTNCTVNVIYPNIFEMINPNIEE